MRAILGILKLITSAAYTNPERSATTPEEFLRSCACYDTSPLCRCVK